MNNLNKLIGGGGRTLETYMELGEKYRRIIIILNPTRLKQETIS